MFNEKELDQRILDYLAKKKYATAPMIAKACNCSYNDARTAIATRLPVMPVCQVWSKRLSMKVWYYTTTVIGSEKKSKSLTSAHKRLQKQWLLQEALRMDVVQLINTHQTLKGMVGGTLKPQYFLLTIKDAVEIYEKLIYALPKP